jgi:hypothetical protein
LRWAFQSMSYYSGSLSRDDPFSLQHGDWTTQRRSNGRLVTQKHDNNDKDIWGWIVRLTGRHKHFSADPSG